jgi:hypothetical protein
MLDATPDRAPTPATPAKKHASTPAAEPTSDTVSGDPSRNGGSTRPGAAEVVDLAPAPPVAVESSSRRARALLVLIVVALALTGFVVRRIGAARRTRQS